MNCILQALFRPENIVSQVGSNFMQFVGTTIGWTVIGSLFGQGIDQATYVTCRSRMHICPSIMMSCKDLSPNEEKNDSCV